MMAGLKVQLLLLTWYLSGVFCSGQGGQVYRLIRGPDDKLRVLSSHIGNDDFNQITGSNQEARALYNRSINQTGWSFLEIHTNASYSNEQQAYGSGYLEGFATHELVYMHWFNTLGDFCSGRKDFCSRLETFIDANMIYIQDQIDRMGDTDEYWHHVKLFYSQIRGLADGYKDAIKDVKKMLTFQDILWLNLQGDFEDLAEVLKAQENNYYANEEYLHPSARGLGHCSALIKILPDGSDLLVSQETWSSYQSMLRIQKKYVMPLTESKASKKRIAGVAMTLSSYPGVITSGDDFYLISSGLVTLETTIGNGNASLWKYVQPNGKVFEGVRSMVANRLATDGRTWSQIFSRFNSGTYNNQWMIVDYNKFNASSGSEPENLPDDLLWVLEQIPDNICAADVTNVLRAQTYWASYNVAYFPQIYNISGNWESVAKFGDWFTYDKNPRALIFNRDHGKVENIKTMLELMRYNDFRHDPLSRCDCNPPYSAENAIAARCDLNPANGMYPFPALGHRQHGATDAKITNSVLFEDGLKFLGVSGPVYNKSRGIPPFSWSTSDFGPTTPHLGHPDLWTFSPLIYQWA